MSAHTPAKVPADMPAEVPAGTRTVSTTYLEQTDRSDLLPSAPPPNVHVVRAEIPNVAFSRFLYAAVGAPWQWTGRLRWTDEQWRAWLERPGSETRVAWCRGTPAGYVELDPQADGVVELAYFGLLPEFIGRGIGGYLLTIAAARAWDLADRWPELAPTRRVWVHTCELDGPHALPNYLARGFRIYEVRDVVEDAPPA